MFAENLNACSYRVKSSCGRSLAVTPPTTDRSSNSHKAPVSFYREFLSYVIAERLLSGELRAVGRSCVDDNAAAASDKKIEIDVNISAPETRSDRKGRWQRRRLLRAICFAICRLAGRWRASFPDGGGTVGRQSMHTANEPSDVFFLASGSPIIAIKCPMQNYSLCTQHMVTIDKSRGRWRKRNASEKAGVRRGDERGTGKDQERAGARDRDRDGQRVRGTYIWTKSGKTWAAREGMLPSLVCIASGEG